MCDVAAEIVDHDVMKYAMAWSVDTEQEEVRKYDNILWYVYEVGFMCNQSKWEPGAGTKSMFSTLSLCLASNYKAKLDSVIA